MKKTKGRRDRKAYHQKRYQAQKEIQAERGRKYREALRNDPVAYLGKLEKERLWKRKAYGYKRTYKTSIRRIKFLARFEAKPNAKST